MSIKVVKSKITVNLLLYRLHILKLQWRYIELNYLCLADLSKSFSNLIVSIFIFSQYFFKRFYPMKKLLSIDCVNIAISSIFFSRICQWKKLYSIDCGNVYLFSIFFEYILVGGKRWGCPTLLISWFININYLLEYFLFSWASFLDFFLRLYLVIKLNLETWRSLIISCVINFFLFAKSPRISYF